MVGGLPDAGFVEPHLIRYSQNTIGSTFKDGSTIEALAEDLRSGRIRPSDVSPIRIFERRGKLFTLDNRRLWAFRSAGLAIPYRTATEQEIRSQAWKFTTRTEGTSVRVKGNP